ncbi:hypothetical protein LAV73_08645 [Lysinibacillus xylanilyticus]|uniref:hypothetical protein n=1 Tax=Lysinibacillus xylanilyticus TaxID=582475 RepID=UPI002B2554A3|nr:hypothetical protein [Lysinibacillus xylanilyticus]MEB2280068.1 hypothetical protein [Lysinibacillus xylanilyticus]
MKNNIIKNIIGLICFTLVFSIISPSFAKASEPQNLQINDSFSQEVINEQEIVNETDGETDGINQDLGGPRINLEDEIQIEPRIAPVIPLLATVTIRYGVPFLARTASKRIVYVTKHAAEQAVDRKITGKMIDDALSNGTKYVDGWSGARIAWLENESENKRTAVLLNKDTDEIDTVYNQKSKKLKWLKSAWQYVGDK